MFHCPVCCAECESTRLLKNHLSKEHAFDFMSEIKCNRGCYRTFPGWKSFQRHILSCELTTEVVQEHVEIDPVHNEIESCNTDEFVEEYSQDIPYDISTFFECSVFSESEALLTESSDNFCDFLKDFKCKSTENAMIFTGKLYSNPDLTRSHVQSVVDSTTQLLSSNVELVSNAISSILTEFSVSEVCKSQVQSCLDLLKKPFVGVHSEYLRMRHLTEHGYFIPPEKFVVGRDPNKLSKNKLTAEFIPFRKVLKCFFELPNVLTSVKNHIEVLHEESTQNIISNFIQAELWKEKLKYFGDKFVLPLFVYFDELETGNPLGSHAGIFKIGAVYIWCPCLPPEYLSLLENYLLAQLCHGDDRKVDNQCFEATNNRVLFMKIVAELNYLSSHGISVQTEQGPEQLYFCLALILGDNQGMNGILGFVEGFTANYFCRICKMHKSVSSSCALEDKSLFRTVDNYHSDVLVNNSNLTGVKENSVWNLVQLFHATHNFVLDWAHDILEGGCAVHDLTEILYNFVFLEKLFTIEQLTTRIVDFDYGPSTNNPPAISENDLKEGHIRMSASEMLTFVRVLGAMIGDLIPEGNNHWQLYLYLVDIVNIVSCTDLQIETVNYLEYLVQQHHILYVQLFGPTLKPKHHNMLHYGTVIRLCGPLVGLWSMRPEARHRLLKRSSNVIASRVDILLSLAIKNQLAFAYRIMSREGFHKRFIISQSSTFMKPSEFDSIDASLLPSGFDMCAVLNSVKNNGTLYKKNVCLVIDTDFAGHPVFGLVDNILMNSEENVCFVVTVLQTENFNRHLHCYAVSDSSCFKCVKLTDLFSYTPVFYAALANGRKCVSLHHYL
ncbi:hypothetical protein FOCC_FOCC002825 [Frankliniella occidentalis]|nr:hypothetical protein FOCC_FOCC002825 [Frankliniella occidentalis]